LKIKPWVAPQKKVEDQTLFRYKHLKLDFVMEMNDTTQFQLHSKMITSFHQMNNVLSINFPLHYSDSCIQEE